MYDENDTIKKLTVIADGKATSGTPEPDRGVTFDVPVEGAVSTIEIEIAGATKASTLDSCLSAVELVRGDDPVQAILGVDGDAAEVLPTALRRIQLALSTPDKQGLERLLDFPFHVGGASHASWAAVVDACKDPRAKACPQAAPVDLRPSRTLALASTPQELRVTIPCKTKHSDVWHLRWHDGGWHLTGID